MWRGAGVWGGMHMDAGFFAVAVPAVLIAGISKGGFGSGAAFASTPLLAMILTPGQALGVMLPLLMVMDLANLRPYWGQWDATAARLLVLGAVPGVALAAALYRYADPDIFRLLIGLIAWVFVAFQIARGRGWIGPALRPPGPGAGLGAGLVTGFTSFVANAGGPPAAVYLLARGGGKTAFQATTVLVFWLINMLKFIPFLALGIASWQTARADLILTPVALAGAWLGIRAHRAVPERAFFALTYVLLVVTGGKFIWDALA